MSTASADKKAMQLAVVNASSALTMPQKEFIEFYCQPIQDDTWIRHEEIVKMENLVESEGGEAIKKEILKDYIEERARTGQTVQPDPILEGMLAQERYMEEYQLSDRRADGDKAIFYRRQLVNNFRRKNPTSQQAPSPFGEEDTDLDSSKASNSDSEGEQNEQAEGEYPTEAEAKPEGEQTEQTEQTEQAEQADQVEGEYPTEAEAKPEGEPQQEEAEETPEEATSSKAAPIASSAAAAPENEQAAAEYPTEAEPAADNAEAFADEL